MELAAVLCLVCAIASAQVANHPGTSQSGEDLYRAGEFAQARQVLEAEAASAKSLSNTSFWLGYTYVALAEREKAIAQFEAYLHDNWSDEDVLYALAKIYAQLAQTNLERIFQIDPQSARAYQMRGIRFELEKSWKEAIRSYERAIQLDSKNRGLYSSIARIDSQELEEKQAAKAALEKELPPILGTPATDRERGVMLMEKGQARESLPFLQRWQAAEPGSPDPHYYLGEAYTDLKVDTIRRLKQASPRSYRLHQILAEDYASVHDRAQAMVEYRQVIAMQPQLPGVHYEMARLVSDTGVEEAVELLKSELRIDPQHYLAKGLLGRIYVALHQVDAAIPLLQGALAAKPNLLEVRKALGQAWAEKKEFANALECFRAVEERNPSDEQIHFLLAQAYTASGNTDEAARERQLHRDLLKSAATHQ